MRFVKICIIIPIIFCRLIQALTTISGQIDETLLPLSSSEIASTFVVLQNLQFHTLATTSLTSNGKFTFHNISEGAYLVDLKSVSLATARNYRVDITPATEGGLSIGVHEVLFGHDVINDLGPQVGFPLSIAATRLSFLQPRPAFSLLSVVKSPMILMSLVSLVMVVAVPKMLENLDPDTLQQLQEHQSKSTDTMDKVSNFDVASFIAERATKNERNSE